MYSVFYIQLFAFFNHHHGIGVIPGGHGKGLIKSGVVRFTLPRRMPQIFGGPQNCRLRKARIRKFFYAARILGRVKSVRVIKRGKITVAV
jgi:hypothetical protein